MRIKLKQFVGIQILKNKIIISGSFKENIYIDNTSNNLNFLKQLKSKEGVDENNKDYEDFIFLLREKKLLEYITGTDKYAKRNLLFYDYIHFDINCILDEPILIFGAGAAGGTVAYLLAQQGFKNLYCIDFDIVEQSDIEKTLIYHRTNLGQFKVDALKKNIKNNFGIIIHSIQDNIKNVIRAEKVINIVKPHLIVYAIDPDPRFKLDLNKLCIKKQIKIIHASYSYEKIICGPCVIPAKTSCWIGYNEYWKSRIDNPFDYNYVSRLFISDTIHPSISFNINILASIIIKDIIFCLGGILDNILTLNKIISIDLISSEIVENTLSCKFCNECTQKCL